MRWLNNAKPSGSSESPYDVGRETPGCSGLSVLPVAATVDRSSSVAHKVRRYTPCVPIRGNRMKLKVSSEPAAGGFAPSSRQLWSGSRTGVAFLPNRNPPAGVTDRGTLHSQQEDLDQREVIHKVRLPDGAGSPGLASLDRRAGGSGGKRCAVESVQIRLDRYRHIVIRSSEVVRMGWVCRSFGH